MNDLLTRALARGRTEKLARLEAGIIDAIPEQVEMPQQLAKLGPSCTDYSFLTDLEHAVAESGLRRTINKYGPIPWIHGVEDLEAEFFELIAGVAPRFDPDLDSAGSLQTALNSISGFIGFSAVEWPGGEDWPSDTRIRAFRRIQFANSFLPTIWSRAFKEGRILLFMSSSQSTRLQPLEERPLHEPTQIQNLFDLVSRKIALLPDNRDAEDDRDPDISDAITMSDMLAIRERTRLFGFSETLVRHVTVHPRSKSEHCFLISGKLSNELTGIHTDRFMGKGPRSGQAMKLEKELMYFFSTRFAELPSSPGKGKCLSMIVAEAADRTGKSEGWNNLAKRVWKKAAPSKWQRPGRRPTNPS